MLSDEWLSRYGPLENFNASVTRTRTRTGTRTGTGTWTTGVTAIALCTSCSRAKNDEEDKIKNDDEDKIKNEDAQVLTTLSINFSNTQGQLTPQSSGI